MKKFLKSLRSWLPLTLIILGSLWLLQVALAHTSSHGVIVRGLNYNAGTVKPGTMVRHAVQIVNLSPEPVEVDAQPSCGCTVIESPQVAIQPLHSGIVTANVDTTGEGKGFQRKGVLLQFHRASGYWKAVATMSFRTN
jgi:hypothetical protein